MAAAEHADQQAEIDRYTKDLVAKRRPLTDQQKSLIADVIGGIRARRTRAGGHDA